MADRIFRDYDREALDREYDNRRKVASAAQFLERFAAESVAVRAEIPCRRDVRFGAHPEETLDIFLPTVPVAGPAPVHVFIHGGYWRALHKDDHSFVARALAPKGAVTVVVNYALVPSVDMDELVRQCRAALAWTWKNAADFGGDRDRIAISGHSAGGHLVGMLLATDWPAFDAALPADPIRSGCGISGLYDLEPIRLCFLNDDLGLDDAAAARNSPVLLPPRTAAPLLLPVGGLEGPEYLRQSLDLAAAWGGVGGDVTVRILPGIQHFSIVEQLADSDSELAGLIAAQIGL